MKRICFKTVRVFNDHDYKDIWLTYDEKKGDIYFLYDGKQKCYLPTTDDDTDKVKLWKEKMDLLQT